MLLKNLVIGMIIGCLVNVVLGAFGLHYANGYAWLNLLVTIVCLCLFLWFQKSRQRVTDLVVRDMTGTVKARITDNRALNYGISLISVSEDGSVLITHGGSDPLVVTGTCRGNLIAEGNVTINTVSATGDIVQHN